MTERWIRNQTRQPDEWIVADDGERACRCTLGQVFVRNEPKPAGVESFCCNMLSMIDRITGDVILPIETDDYYGPNHVADIVRRLETADIAGTDRQPYYNIQHARYRVFDNFGACLGQTGFRRELLPMFVDSIHDNHKRGKFGVDAGLWQRAFDAGVKCDAFKGGMDTVGIKGMPGRVGLGVGHRPDHTWAKDDDYSVLRKWIGNDDAEIFVQVAAWRPKD